MMKKTMLCCALVSLFASQLYADVPQQANPPQPQTSAPLPSAIPATSPTQAPVPTEIATPPTIPEINCEYKVPPETKQIEQSLITKWTEKAIVQAFDLDHSTIDDEMHKLKNCFTDQGWTGFTTALEKSGNIQAIKAQKLNVSSQVDGSIEMGEVKDNIQWKMNVPLQVVYQNDKEKVTQLLRIHVTVGRKPSGDLGIMQMIATPRSDDSQKQEPPSIAPTNPAIPQPIPVPPTHASAPEPVAVEGAPNANAATPASNANPGAAQPASAN